MIYDISPPITERLAVWPGDTPLSRETLLDRKRGDNITLSTLRATVHLGAHVDAPSHYGKDAPAVDEWNLNIFLGLCQVVHVHAARREQITSSRLPERIETERLLIATGTYPDPERFNQDFAALSPELVETMHGKGVKLIGVDTPSVDLFESKDLPTHHAFLRCGMAVLEGLVLHDVPEGTYELIALPLKLVGFDASPVRAVLRTVPSNT
jgi:arylformamidase